MAGLTYRRIAIGLHLGDVGSGLAPSGAAARAVRVSSGRPWCPLRVGHIPCRRHSRYAPVKMMRCTMAAWANWTPSAAVLMKGAAGECQGRPNHERHAA
jgi:hypothetical protein